MNERSKNFLRQWWNEPRRFFLWFALFSLSCCIALLLSFQGHYDGTGALESAEQATRPIPSALAWIAFGGLACFGASVGGFVLSWIPALRQFFAWLLHRRFLVAVCGVTLIALFLAVENWRGKRAWENFKREAEAKGERLELADIIPPPVPDDQNFAASPLFREMCNEFDLEWRRAHTGPNGITNRLDRFKLSPWRTTYADVSVGDWCKGERTDLKAWQNYYRNAATTSSTTAQVEFARRYGLEMPKTAPAARPIEAAPESANEFPVALTPQTPAADVLLALSKFDSVVEELREASRRPQSRFPIHYEDGFMAYLPHLQALRLGSQLLALRASAELASDQNDKALADVKLSFRVMDLVKREPLFISQLIRTAQLRFTLSPVWEGLADHKWTDAQLAALESELGKLDFLADYHVGMRGERAFSIWTMNYLRRNRDMRIIAMNEQQNRQPGPLVQSFEEAFGMVLFRLMPGGWFEQNKVALGQMYRDYVLPAVDREHSLVSPAAVHRIVAASEVEAQHRTPYSRFARALAKPLEFALGNGAEVFARSQSAVGLARVGCALDRYRLAHSQYPEALDALVPQFIAKLPRDVINGQPLKYRRMDEGRFILYSVGWNEKDDGGQIALANGAVDWKQGDWVWQMPVR